MLCREEFIRKKVPDFLVIREQVTDPLTIEVEYLDVFLHRPVREMRHVIERTKFRHRQTHSISLSLSDLLSKKAAITKTI